MDKLAWGDPIDGWRLAAALDKTTFSAGEPIVLTVALQNTSPRDRAHDPGCAELDTELECRDGQGNPTSPTALGRRLAERRDPPRTSQATLATGQVFVHEVSASQRLDLSLPGSYTVTVTRCVPRAGAEAARLVSQPCHLEITERG